MSSVDRTHTLEQVRQVYSGLDAGEASGEVVTIAGRVMLNRTAGKLVFATVRDFTGDLQVMLSQGHIGAEDFDVWKSYVDLGDWVAVTGEVITSRRGELSVMADAFSIVSKCLVPLPDKHKGLTDPEARVRNRHVDLIVNEDARRMLRVRSAVVRSVRESLWRRGYLEVETPMLQRVHGGANARPFETHINAYDLDLSLRIAPELYLKRLLVGGAEKIFELNRNFRNEGADSTHNPEFTSLEIYDAYGNYDTMRELTREIILEAAVAVYGEPVIHRRTTSPDGEESVEVVDISGEWPVRTVLGAISEAVGTAVTMDTTRESLIGLCERHQVPIDSGWSLGAIVLEMYERLCEEATTTPVFYQDFPTEVSPLTRSCPTDGRIAQRWDLVAYGAELGTAYTELIDPLEQRNRLELQSRQAAAGDEEAMQVDEDFLRTLEYGMPPAGGQGMGIDRLVMFLTGRNIRQTVLFPLTKPESRDAHGPDH